MALKIGDIAPDFTLKSKNQTGEIKDFSLSNFKDTNVVLLFYPLSFTGVCTTEMCSISAGFNEYANLNAKVLGISVDSVFTQEAWAKSNGITIPLLSDFNKEVAKSYGCLYEDFIFMKGVAKRSAFIVDKDGKIAYEEILEDAGQLPNFDKIKEILNTLK